MRPFNPYPGSKIAPASGSPPGQPARGSKIAPASTDRGVASVQAPQTTPGRADDRVSIYTYITKIQTTGDGTPILYNGDSLWRRITVTLETAGPVAVGQSADIFPVLSGKGQLLATGVPTSFNIAKGDRLYVVATSVNRVKVVSEALPWLELITGLIGQVVTAVGGAIGSAFGKIA